jgi:hypothetical protein
MFSSNCCQTPNSRAIAITSSLLRYRCQRRGSSRLPNRHITPTITRKPRTPRVLHPYFQLPLKSHISQPLPFPPSNKDISPYNKMHQNGKPQRHAETQVKGGTNDFWTHIEGCIGNDVGVWAGVGTFGIEAGCLGLGTAVVEGYFGTCLYLIVISN